MLDLPTLGRPTMATARALSVDSVASLVLGGGSSATSCSIRSPVPVPLMAETAIGSRPSSQKSATCSSPHHLLLLTLAQTATNASDTVPLCMTTVAQNALKVHCGSIPDLTQSSRHVSPTWHK